MFSLEKAPTDFPRSRTTSTITLIVPEPSSSTSAPGLLRGPHAPHRARPPREGHEETRRDFKREARDAVRRREPAVADSCLMLPREKLETSDAGLPFGPTHVDLVMSGEPDPHHQHHEDA
ncbi:MAG: hypothetical protein M1358_11010 [Chloroflexi bacterium]|nr:hypothetical protein [Chloroflexota bacterium]